MCAKDSSIQHHNIREFQFHFDTPILKSETIPETIAVTVTIDAIYDVVETLEAQIPNSRSVVEFFKNQDASMWEKLVADSDGVNNRQLWTRTANYTRSKKIYDINRNNTKRSVLDTAAAKAEYKKLIDSYAEAFNMPQSF